MPAAMACAMAAVLPHNDSYTTIAFIPSSFPVLNNKWIALNYISFSVTGC
jgi:hypothetical protein